MALSSSSTIQNAVDQYNDSLGFLNDPTKAAALCEAIVYMWQHEAAMYTLPNFTYQRQKMDQLYQDAKAVATVGTAGDTTQKRRTFCVGRAG